MSGIIRKEDMHESFWKEGISNPNLLINGDFKNPVNQRNKTLYGNGDIYTIDRWRFHLQNDSLNEKLEVLEDYIKLTILSDGVTSSRGFSYLQIVEKCNIRKNTKYVISAKIEESNKDTFSFYVAQYGKPAFAHGIKWNSDRSLAYFEFVTPNDFNGDLFVAIDSSEEQILKIKNDDYIKIEWFKLEIGDKPTAFYPRLYAEELVLCKRYYERNEWCSLICPVIGSLRGFNFQVEKRSIPSVTFKTLPGQAHKFNAWAGNSGFSDSESVIVGASTIGVNYIDNLGNEIKPNNIYLTSWEADSEIY